MKYENSSRLHAIAARYALLRAERAAPQDQTYWKNQALEELEKVVPDKRQ